MGMSKRKKNFWKLTYSFGMGVPLKILHNFSLLKYAKYFHKFFMVKCPCCSMMIFSSKEKWSWTLKRSFWWKVYADQNDEWSKALLVINTKRTGYSWILKHKKYLKKSKCQWFGKFIVISIQLLPSRDG
jgi:hypothetical protein